MIVPYIRPQDTITQLLRRNPVRPAPRRNPLVIGPEYKLMLDDGRDIATHSFSGDGASLDFMADQYTLLDLSRYVPVGSSAQLRARRLHAIVASITSGVMSADESDPLLRSLRINADLIAGVGTLNAILDGRAVRVGDILQITSTSTAPGSTTSVVRRLVTGLLGKVTPGPAAASLAKSQAATNANTTKAAEGATLISGATTAGLVIDSIVGATADLAEFLEHGTIIVDGSARYLGDRINISVTTGGAAGTAVVQVSSMATGLTAAVTTVDDDGLFEISLEDVGYPNTSITVSAAANSDLLVLGDTVSTHIHPAYTPTPTSSLTVGGKYTARTDRRYAVEVTSSVAGTVDIIVYDTSGSDPTLSYEDVAGDGARSLGSGLTVALGSGSYYKGQKFFIDAIADVISQTAYDGVTLDGPAIDMADHATAGPGSSTVTGVVVHQVYSGAIDSSFVISSGDPIELGEEGWSYVGGLGLPAALAGRTSAARSLFADGYGSVALSYKALRKPEQGTGAMLIQDPSDLADKVGEAHLENWLGRGCAEAMRGNQGGRIYALRTGGDTVEDFADALKKVTQMDMVYALAAMTDNQDVMELVRDHCETMSSPTVKNFRRAYVGTDSPGSYVRWGLFPDDTYVQASLASTVLTVAEGDRGRAVFSPLDVGSEVLVISLGTRYKVVSIISPYEAVLDVDPLLTTGPVSSGVTLTRPDTPQATADYVIQRSKALSSRRISNVWADRPVTEERGGTRLLPCKFIAAELAGLRCALLPQQGLTMTEVRTPSAIPGMYARFTPDLLDDIAANGTWLITQESEGGEIFVRHQLTTKVDPGLALAYEDNVGVIVDDFSFALKDTFRKYIGRRNATELTIIAMRNELQELAIDYTLFSFNAPELGPPVLTFFSEEGQEGEVTVRQDGVLADTLLTYTRLRVPLPLNGINHYVDVEATDTLSVGG